MATKSSIHIKPCNVKSSGAHNRRTTEYMRNINKSKIYIVPELTADNEQWMNPGFGDPDLQVHYDNIKRMVKEKTGRAMQEKERERKGKNGKIIKVAGCSPIREGVYTGRRAKIWRGMPEALGHHTAPNLPAQGRGTLAKRATRSRGQREFQGRRKMVQAELSCAHRFRLDEPRYRQEPQTQ